jgi:WD40 repeat protein
MIRNSVKNWIVLLPLIFVLSACGNTEKNQPQELPTPFETNIPTVLITDSPIPDYPAPVETETIPAVAYPAPQEPTATLNLTGIGSEVINKLNADQLALSKSITTEAPVRLDWSLDQTSITLIGYDFFNVYSFPELQLLFEYSNQPDEFLVAISPDGQTYATTYRDGDLIFHNWITKETSTIKTGLQFMSADFSPDGSEIMIPQMDKWAGSIYDVSNGKLISTVTGFETAAPIYNVLFSSDGKQAIWIARGTIQLSDISTNTMHPAIYHQDFISSFATSPDGKSLATAAGDLKNDTFVPAIFLYDTFTSDKLNSKEMQKSVYSMSFSPDNTLLAVDSAGSVLIIDAITFEEIYRFDAHPESINQIAFSPDGKIIATTGSDQEVKFWSIP